MRNCIQKIFLLAVVIALLACPGSLAATSNPVLTVAKAKRMIQAEAPKKYPDRIHWCQREGRHHIVCEVEVVVAWIIETDEITGEETRKPWWSTLIASVGSRGIKWFFPSIYED